MAAKRFFLVVMILLAWAPHFAGAQEEGTSPEAQTPPEDTEVYRIPEAEVSEERDSPEKITREEMDRSGANDLWEAVQYAPGVILSGGGRRNDSSFTVRGYGPDSVPIYADGIPQASPYRGDGDSARILTGDLESVEIDKGYSSELLGANTLGGAILLRMAKPKEPFEASAKTSWTLDSTGRYADSAHVIGLGTRLDMFYGKAVFQYRDVDHYRLPGSFEPAADNPQQKGDRLFSDSTDLKLTLLAGITPIPDLDIWLSYVYQKADKGVSPPETKIRDYSLWDWPVWNRWSASLNASYSVGSVSFSGLFYFDKYDNRLDEYHNLSNLELGLHSPHSDYDEFALGGRLIGKWEINGWNTVQGAVTYKKEDHRGLRGVLFSETELNEVVHVNEDTWSVGAEYMMNPWKPLTIKAGVGLDALIPNTFWSDENEFNKLLGTVHFIVKTRDMYLYTWQAGAFYTFTTGKDSGCDHELRLTYARKNHFPNMSLRYSTRFGSTLPNPNLGPEIANHFELGYRLYYSAPGKFISALNLNAAAYYSFMEGKIVTIELPNPDYPSALVDYARNLDSTSFWGFELSPELSLKNFLSTGLALSVNKYVINKSQDGIKVLSYYPQFTLNGYMVIKPAPMLSIIPRIEYISSRYADTLGETTLDDYFLAHLKISADLGKYLTISASADNILDTYYEISRNFPLAGRTFTLALTAKY
jgi:iron complex outermembrane receptor protein